MGSLSATDSAIKSSLEHIEHVRILLTAKAIVAIHNAFDTHFRLRSCYLLVVRGAEGTRSVPFPECLTPVTPI